MRSRRERPSAGLAAAAIQVRQVPSSWFRAGRRNLDRQYQGTDCFVVRVIEMSAGQERKTLRVHSIACGHLPHCAQALLGALPRVSRRPSLRSPAPRRPAAPARLGYRAARGRSPSRRAASLSLSLSPRPLLLPPQPFGLFDHDTAALQSCLNPSVVERAVGRETDAVRHAFDVDDALPLAHRLVCDGRRRRRGRPSEDLVGRARAIGGARGLRWDGGRRRRRH
eukprot:scaffold49150_cov71-Phaeocystis_antarctica.AAC.5